MDDYLINGETLGNIADKIREKAPEAYEGNTVTPEEMPDAVDEVWQAGYNEGSKSVDLSSYQTKHDENLKTESKEIVDAINELKEILGEGAIDGKTPYIQDGYWYIDGTNTNVKAQGENGKDGADGKDGIDGKDGNDYVLTDADKEEIAEIVAENISPSENKPTDLTGLTFVLKEDIGEKLYYTVGAKYNVNFTSNGEDFIGFELCHDSDDADNYSHLQYWLSNTQGRNVYNYTRSSNSGNFSNNEYRTVTFTGGADVKNPDLIELIYSIGVIESPYQTKHDETLETESKEIVGAINELNEKIGEGVDTSNLATIDKIDSIALTNYDAQSISTTDGLVWRDDSTFTIGEDDYDNIPTTHRVPIVAGENVTFEVDEENQVVKINATGGGSSENSVLSVTVETDYPTTMFAIIEAIQSAGGDLSKLTFVTLTGYTTCNLMMSFQWRGGNYYRAECIDLGTMEKIYNPATDNSIYDVTSKRIEDFLQEGTQNEVEKVEMPQIRFVSMPCDGWFGFVNWEEINGEQNTSEENLKFTIEIVGGGALQVGDAIQLCRMGHYGVWIEPITGKVYPQKRKLRRLFEYTITEEDLDKRFITFEVPWNDKKAIKLFTKWSTKGVNDKTIYFRIRRPKGQINSGNNGGGMTVDAEFSNVVSIRCLSYGFAWSTPDDEEISFYQIRIT